MINGVRSRAVVINTLYGCRYYICKKQYKEYARIQYDKRPTLAQLVEHLTVVVCL